MTESGADALELYCTLIFMEEGKKALWQKSEAMKVFNI